MLIIAKDGEIPTEDFHLISSWAYTIILNSCSAAARRFARFIWALFL